jgi:predicted ATP-grasp superfamily ATP-dependent carboligase
MYKGISVLIFGAGGRQALPVCKGFYQLGCNVICYCKTKLDTGYMTRYRTSAILFDKVKKDKEDFNSCGERLIKENHFDIVVPLGDAAAIFLSSRKTELSKFSKIAVNEWDVFQNAIDKLNTMRICQEKNIPAIHTILMDDPSSVLIDNQLTQLEYPIVVKPRTGAGSVGFQIIRSREKLEGYLSKYDNRYGPLLIQEYIEQDNHPQYRADLFRDRDGKYKLVMVGEVTRWYPLDGGSGVFAYTIHDEEIADNCMRLLDEIHWNGYANIDMVWDAKTNKAKILEINGRTGATIKLDYLAGANISKLILENELGYPVTDMMEYKDNCRMTCFLPDLLWFIKSKNRFRTVPSWFDRRGVYDAIFSWDDPLPSIGFLLNSIKGFMKSMNRRKRI